VKRLSRGQKYNNFTSGVDAYSRGALIRGITVQKFLNHRMFFTERTFLKIQFELRNFLSYRTLLQKEVVIENSRKRRRKL